MLRCLRLISILPRWNRWATSALWLSLPVLLSGCPPQVIPGGAVSNGTDPTNGGASYLGSATCQTCHPQIGAQFDQHGHSQILKRIQGIPPQYPTLPQAGVPNPPPGLAWTDISFVIGGYTKAANFVNRNGFLLTDSATGDPIQYNLALPHEGNTAAFVPSAGMSTTPYSFDCFRCHTTGPQPVTTTGQREDNLPGIGGNWAQDSVGCEACHGPGSNHVPNPAPDNIYIDPTSNTCANCHSSTTGQLQAKGGFIVGNQQANELAVSPHAGFNCTICHAPHASVFADPASAIRNDCPACHPSQNMAFHQGIVYTQGNYTETLTCRSCHMSFADKYAQSAPPERTAGLGRVGDTHNHVFIINTNEQNFSSMFTADGTGVALDAQGRASVTVDFVCLRCHHGQGNAFVLSLHSASQVAAAIHTPQ